MAERLEAMGQANYRNGFKLTLQPQMLELPAALAKAPADLRQFDERPVSSGCASALYPSRLRRHGSSPLARVSSSNQARRTTSGVIRAPRLETQYLDGRECRKRAVHIAHQLSARYRRQSEIPVERTPPWPIGQIDLTHIDWVIVGGESGPGARPMQRDWVIDIRRQCRAARVPFFLQTVGRRKQEADGPRIGRTHLR